MAHSFFSVADRFPRLRRRHAVSAGKHGWSLGGARMNPEIRNVQESGGIWGQLFAELHNRVVRARWQRELRSLDDRLLRDVGISRTDISRVDRRPGFWI